MLRDWRRRNELSEVDTFLEVIARPEVLMARYVLRGVRSVENQRFFDLRYRQYREFADSIRHIEARHIVYDTSD